MWHLQLRIMEAMRTDSTLAVLHSVPTWYGALDKSVWPYWVVGALSPSNSYYAAGPMNGCGQCFQIVCENSGGQFAGRCYGDGRSVTIMVSDSCPECEADHIDLQVLTYEQLGPQDLGRIDIQYRRVPCTPPIDMLVDVDGNHGAGYWLRMNVQEVADRGAITNVEVRGPGGSWMQLNNKYGAAWEVDNSPSSYPLDLRITQDDGQQVTSYSALTQPGSTGKTQTNMQFKVTGSTGGVTPISGYPSTPGSSSSASSSATTTAPSPSPSPPSGTQSPELGGYGDTASPAPYGHTNIGVWQQCGEYLHDHPCMADPGA
ncbi:hypothetical protein WJX74_008497 [Apatococcus lobatus]|uniref:Expansin-like EG45 domain-containing protein n=1 Tax=Apatococcus lobatus TaxID=904363 RepID=A0AAW1S048_9CHLO